MTDRELLELAAKAAGIALVWEDGGKWCFIPEFLPPHNRRESDRYAGVVWNPLTDDGDALRLAVKLGLCVNVTEEVACVEWGLQDSGPCGKKLESLSGDRYAATRSAIVRAAAEVGKRMP